jgi:hypothetical protein
MNKLRVVLAAGCAYSSVAATVLFTASCATPPATAEYLLTFCVLVLRNGFTVTGESACASPENFCADVGRKISRAHALNKVWPLLGFQLRSVLAR